MINGKIVAAFVLHSIVFLALCVGDCPDIFVMTLGVFLALNVIGLMMLLFNAVQPGGIIFMVGSFAFIPIGLIGMLGAREAMDEVRRREFSKKG